MSWEISRLQNIFFLTKDNIYNYLTTVLELHTVGPQFVFSHNIRPELDHVCLSKIPFLTEPSFLAKIFRKQHCNSPHKMLK